MPSILMPFQKFAYEGAAIGRLLAGYTTLEAGLFNCVQVALGDFDGVFKAMFTQRGATPRIGGHRRICSKTHSKRKRHEISTLQRRPKTARFVDR